MDEAGYDDEFLVLALGHFIMDLVIADEVVGAHRIKQDRDRNLLNVAGSGVIARAIIDAIDRVRRQNRVGAQEGFYGQEAAAVVEGVVRFGVCRNRQTDTLDDMSGVDGTIVFKQCPRLFRAVQNACVQRKEFRRCALADYKRSVVGIRVLAGVNLPLDFQGLIDQLVQPGRLTLEVGLLEVLRVSRFSVRVITVFWIKRIQFFILFFVRIIFVGYRRIVASQHSNGADSGVGVDENDTICGRQPDEACRTGVITFDQLVGILTKGDSSFGDGLIKAHGRPASAVAPQYNLGNSRSKSGCVLPKKVDSGFHVEGCFLEYDLGFVIVEPGVHAKDDETPIPHLTAGTEI